MAARKQDHFLGAGSRAPQFRLQDLSGEPQSLDDILARGPALLAFFKVSCPVCQFTFPFLERLHEAGGDERRVQIIGVSQDKAAATRDFNDEFGVSFPTLLDDAAAGYPVSNAFGIRSVPTMFLIERDGSISASEAGFSKKDLEAVGERIGVTPFRPGERIPEHRPG